MWNVFTGPVIPTLVDNPDVREYLKYGEMVWNDNVQLGVFMDRENT